MNFYTNLYPGGQHVWGWWTFSFHDEEHWLGNSRSPQWSPFSSYATSFLSFSAPWRVRRPPVTSLFHLHLWRLEVPIRLGQKHLQYQYTFRPKLTALTFVSLCTFSKLKAEGWVWKKNPSVGKQVAGGQARLRMFLKLWSAFNVDLCRMLCDGWTWDMHDQTRRSRGEVHIKVSVV